MDLMTSPIAAAAPKRRERALPPVFAGRLALPVLAAVVALTIASPGYGYHRDELYFRMLPVAWGYEDQPPLTPWLAHAAITVFGDHLWAERLPATLCFALAIVVAALTTREFGGGRTAQTLSAWAFAFAAVPLAFGHVLITATPDLVLWSTTLLFAARAVLRVEPRWWVAAGAMVGVASYNKYLIVMLVIALGIGLAIAGPRAEFRSRWLWLGIAAALVIGSPNLAYQALHHWPQLTMTKSISADKGPSDRLELIPFQIVLLGPPLLPFWISGFVALLRRPEWRRARAIALAYPAALLIVLAAGGQIYYALGELTFLLAVGCVPVADWIVRPGRSRRLRTTLVVLALVGNAADSIVADLPVVPASDLHDTPITDINQATRDQLGWGAYVREISAAYRAVPVSQRSSTVMITGNYSEAGAISRYGGGHGSLPPIFSGHNALYFYGPPPASATGALTVGLTRSFLLRSFARCTAAGTLDNQIGIDNQEQGQPIFICTGREAPWTQLWPRFRHDD
jgi:Dolichyl-phosphate-mannose-protein mannosyltransferase